jgi:Zn-dependent protease with chaperone function
LFLGSLEIRKNIAYAPEIVLAISVMLQLVAQNSAEKKLAPPPSDETKPDEIKKDEIGRLALRVAVSWLLGGILYVLVLTLTIRASAWAAELLHLSSRTSLAVLFLGGGLGIMIGLGINFALSPLQLKKMLPTHPVEDSTLKRYLEGCFKKAGLKTPVLRIIELHTVQMRTAVLTGFKSGWGPLKQALFISRSALSALSPAEVRAIVLNQISHVVLRHFQKRFFFSFCLISGTTLMAILSVLVSENLTSAQAPLQIFGPAIALISFFVSFRILANQTKKHEFEADLHSIEKLGVPVEDFISALRKQDVPLLIHDPAIPTLPHPDTERRINLLLTYLSQNKKPEQITPPRDQAKAS